MWNGNNGDAPDIAFLKIPELDARRLEAQGGVFYNLGRERNFAPSKPNHRMSKAYAVVGVVGEWTEESPAMQAKGKKIMIGERIAGNGHSFSGGAVTQKERAPRGTPKGCLPLTTLGMSPSRDATLCCHLVVWRHVWPP